MKRPPKPSVINFVRLEFKPAHFNLSALASVRLAAFIKGVLLQCHNGTNTELKIEPEEGGRRKRRRLSGEKGHSSTSSRHGSVATIRNLLLGVTWRSVLMFAFCLCHVKQKQKRRLQRSEVTEKREAVHMCVCVCGGHSNSEASWGHLWKSTQAPPLPVQRHVQAQKQHRSHNCLLHLPAQHQLMVQVTS